MDLANYPDGYETAIELNSWESTKLPIGIIDDNERVQHVEYAQMDNYIDDLLTNDKLRKARPQTWMARLVSLLLTELAGHNPREEFLAKKGKALPDIVKRLPLLDAGFVIMQGHIANFGTKLEGIRKECPHCSSNNLFTLDLESLRIVDHEKDPTEPVSVLLPDGFKVNIENAAYKLPDNNKTFNYFEFRIATVADAMRQEKWYRPNAIMSFSQRIASSTVVQIENRDPSNPQIPGESLSSDARTLLGQDILSKVTGGSNRQAIRKQLNSLPRIWLSQECECENCSEFYPVEAPYEELFPLT